MSRAYSIPRPVVDVITRFSEVVCPPEVRSEHLLEPLVRELDVYLSGLPRHRRLTMLALFVVFDQSARLSPGSRPRRFASLDRLQAERYVERCLSGPLGLRRTLTTTLKGIITFNYYELPQVKARLGYFPEPYITEVSERRLRLHGDDVRRGEAGLLADGESS